MVRRQPSRFSKSACALLIAAFAGIWILVVEKRALAEDADSGTFVLDFTFDHPIEAVWDAITKKTLVDKYYFSPINSDVTQVGADIYYGPASKKLIAGTVIAVEAPHLLKHSFRFAEEADTSKTIVTYALTSDGTQTRLHLEHQGYAAGSQGYSDIAGGWPIIINGLKIVLDKK